MTRVVASILATIWMVAGGLAIVLGLSKGRWLPPLLGALALFYGLIWLRVAREGRQLAWREALTPWRRP